MSGVSMWRLWISENKLAVLAAGVVFVLVAGSLITAEHYARRSEELTFEALTLKGQIDEKDSQRLDALALLGEAKAWSDAANQRVAELEKRLASKPKPRSLPRPPPPPQNLSKSLSSLG